jgi:3-isopropylmalate/(R)-2-methylmalate dehydratase small subunit
VIECKGIKGRVNEGDELEVDLGRGRIKNLTTGEDIDFFPFPEFMLEIIDAGGLYSLIRKKSAQGDVPLYARVPME